MIAKPTPAAAAGEPATPRKRRRTRVEDAPLEVRLSLKVRFGEGTGETVTLMDDRRVPMVNSVFDNRDRILRAFTTLLLRASLSQPKVMREILPALRLFGKQGS